MAEGLERRGLQRSWHLPRLQLAWPNKSNRSTHPRGDYFQPIESWSLLSGEILEVAGFSSLFHVVQCVSRMLVLTLHVPADSQVNRHADTHNGSRAHDDS